VKVLVLGAGAREHAIVRALTEDPEVDAVLVAPGNPGIDVIARCLPEETALTDPGRMADLAERQRVDLVVIGPEAPLVAGVADAVRARGIACFGPSREAARLEGSKSFAKEVMAQAGVPTALAHICTTAAQVDDALDATGSPYVVKDDGLAAGKGVVVCEDLAQARAHAGTCLGRPDGCVVVEEYLDGPEVSLFCLTDGTTVVPLAPAQDFKRVGDGDTGPNTGGMGAYSPLPWVPEDLVEQTLERVARPTVAEMARRGTPFAGVLYVGLALTSRGPRVVEFNARFGDPETQSVLARLRSPLGQLLLAAAEGRLHEAPELQWRPDAAVTVVVAAPGYPEAPRTGGPVEGLDEAAEFEGVHVLHAGTARDGEGRVVSAGGRVLSVVGTGPDLAAARDRAYRAVARVSLDGGHHRTDIAAAAATGAVTVPSQVG
jgi:phosphoribosylamine---glycine ligase